MSLPSNHPITQALYKKMGAEQSFTAFDIYNEAMQSGLMSKPYRHCRDLIHNHDLIREALDGGVYEKVLGSTQGANGKVPFVYKPVGSVDDLKDDEAIRQFCKKLGGLSEDEESEPEKEDGSWDDYYGVGINDQAKAERSKKFDEKYNKGRAAFLKAEGNFKPDLDKPADDSAACDPPDACKTHGRCWTHSDWQKDPPQMTSLPQRLAEAKNEPVYPVVLSGLRLDYRGRLRIPADVTRRVTLGSHVDLVPDPKKRRIYISQPNDGSVSTQLEGDGHLWVSSKLAQNAGFPLDPLAFFRVRILQASTESILFVEPESP
jgi:hypothetical protein